MIRSLIRTVRDSLDPAIATASVHRILQAASGLISLAFIARFFSAEQQGYHFAFVSILALQQFLELGLLIVVVVVASHEWSALSTAADGSVVGPLQKLARLADLARFVVRWFASVSLLFLLGVAGAGWAFFAKEASNDVHWTGPWLVLVCSAAVNLFGTALLSLLDGCSQVLATSRCRLAQTLVSSTGFWIALTCGAGLWATAVQMTLNALSVFVFLASRRRFFASLIAVRNPSTFSWRLDVWPMQWPLALQGVAAYFLYSVFVPVIFRYHGAAEAGRFGVALQLAGAVSAIAGVWLNVRVPTLGSLASHGRHAEFERLWRNTAVIVLLATALGAVSVVTLSWVLAIWDPALYARIAEPGVLLALLGWSLVAQAVQCLALYWRTLKREPLGFLGPIPPLLTGAAVWFLGRKWGSAGAACGALSVAIGVWLPLFVATLVRMRRRWLGEIATTHVASPPA